jgi:hypothetical protein
MIFFKYVNTFIPLENFFLGRTWLGLGGTFAPTRHACALPG